MTTVLQWRSCKAAEADDDDQDDAQRFRGFAWPQLSIGCNVRAPPPTTYTLPSILATLRPCGRVPLCPNEQAPSRGA
jgi:hypothetical protein